MYFKQLFFPLLFVSLYAISQNQTAMSQVAQLKSSVLKGQPMSIDKAFFMQAPDLKQAILTLSEAFADTNISVRIELCRTVGYVAGHSQSKELIDASIKLLTKALDDPATQVVGVSIDALSNLERTKFMPQQIAKIRANLKATQKQLLGIMKLIGYVGDSTDIITLKNLVQGADLAYRQTSSFAQIRLGDVALRQRIVNKMENMPINEQFVSNALPDLLYTHQKEIYKGIIRGLYSNDKNCSSPNPNSSEKVSCAYFLMEALTPYIKDYPIKLNALGEMDLPSNNGAYEKALQNVRDWFVAHPDFELNNNKF